MKTIDLMPIIIIYGMVMFAAITILILNRDILNKDLFSSKDIMIFIGLIISSIIFMLLVEFKII